jgi:hypothetical protein
MLSKFVCTVQASESLLNRFSKSSVHNKSLHRALAGLPYVT